MSRIARTGMKKTQCSFGNAKGSKPKPGSADQTNEMRNALLFCNTCGGGEVNAELLCLQLSASKQLWRCALLCDHVLPLHVFLSQCSTCKKQRITFGTFVIELIACHSHFQTLHCAVIHAGNIRGFFCCRSVVCWDRFRLNEILHASSQFYYTRVQLY